MINKTIPNTLPYKWLTIRDTDKKYELQGDFLGMITIKNYNVDLAKLAAKKLMFDFAKEMYFDEKALGKKTTDEKSLTKMLNSPAIVASRISTIFSPENSNELFDRLKLLLQEKQAGIISNITDEEIIAIADKLLEYKCISTK